MFEKKIVAATGNKGKLAEIKSIFKGFEIVSMKELGIFIDIDENGKTFLENAYIKASEISKLTTLPVLSDDSGLSVDVLGGAPGVFSARYAGENATDDENIDKLLLNIKCTPENNRTASFTSVVCLVMPDGTKYFGEGVLTGSILTERRGSNGFGYDPVFYLKEYGKTYAELTDNEKNSLSHRKLALDDLLSKICHLFK